MIYNKKKVFDFYTHFDTPLNSFSSLCNFLKDERCVSALGYNTWYHGFGCLHNCRTIVKEISHYSYSEQMFLERATPYPEPSARLFRTLVIWRAWNVVRAEPNGPGHL